MDNKSINYRIFLAYCISIVILFVVYSQNLSDAFRGEMWELLSIYASDTPFIDKIKNVSQFVCFGAGRFQPLAFFVPYLQYSLISSSFVGSHLFALSLHLACGFLLAFIASQYIKNWMIVFGAYLVFIFSFIVSDVVIWTFFTYIQVHSVLLFFSIALFILYIRSGKRKYVYGSWIAGIVSTLIYEAAISLFFSQVIYSIISRRIKSRSKLLLEVIAPFLIIGAYLVSVHLISGLEYKDSNTKFHPMIFAKVISFLFYYFRHNTGLSSEPIIYNIASLGNLSINLSAWNILGLIILFAFGVYSFYSVLRARERRGLQGWPEFWFMTIVLLIYISIIAFGRVPQGSKFLEPTGLETQFRYYYFPTIAILFLIALTIDRFLLGWFGKALISVALIFVVTGNIVNIVKFGARISHANAPLSAHANLLIAQSEQNDDTDKSFIKKMHYDWYTEKIITPRVYNAFTYNANRCINHSDYLLKKHDKAEELTISQPLNMIDSSNLQPVREVNIAKFIHSANSYFPETNPQQLANNGAGMWHVVHIPQPPQSVWVKIDFGSGNQKQIVGLQLMPRPGKPDHFWDDAIFQGSNDDKEWDSIVQIAFGQPPKEGWTSIRFANSKKYRWYRLFIRGGFSAGRFLSFSGWKMYEPIPTQF